MVMEQKVAALFRIALGVITDRLLTIVALSMTFALATWIMNNPDWLRLCAFAVFCVCVFLPVLYKERNHEQTISKPVHSNGDEAL
jgi:hypothetical protein